MHFVIQKLLHVTIKTICKERIEGVSFFNFLFKVICFQILSCLFVYFFMIYYKLFVQQKKKIIILLFS